MAPPFFVDPSSPGASLLARNALAGGSVGYLPGPFSGECPPGPVGGEYLLRGRGGLSTPLSLGPQPACFEAPPRHARGRGVKDGEWAEGVAMDGSRNKEGGPEFKGGLVSSMGTEERRVSREWMFSQQDVDLVLYGYVRMNQESGEGGEGRGAREESGKGGEERGEREEERRQGAATGVEHALSGLRLGQLSYG